MPRTLKESDISQDTPTVAPPKPSAGPNGREAEAAKPQPVCLEIRVSVHGVQVVAGGGKREPFRETTQTVLVFANGAVLRLAAVVSPGQLLFLTNERNKREVVCQVVKSKSYRNVSGYVELEFTEPAQGFWGLHFPGDKLGAGPAAAQEASPAPAAAAAESSAAPPLPEVVLAPPAAVPAKSIAPEPPPVAAPELHAGEAIPLPPAIPAVSEQIRVPAGAPAVQPTGPASMGFFAPPAPVSPLAAEPPRAVREAPRTPAAAAPNKSRNSSANSLLSKEEEIAVPDWLSPAAYSVPAPSARRSEPAAATRSTAKGTLPLERSAGADLATSGAEPIGHFQQTSQRSTTPDTAPAFDSRILLPEERSAGAGKTRAGHTIAYLAVAALALIGLAGGAWYLRHMPGPLGSVPAAATAATPSTASARAVSSPVVESSALPASAAPASTDSLPPIPFNLEQPLAAPARGDLTAAAKPDKAGTVDTPLKFVDPEKQPKKTLPGIRLAAPVAPKYAPAARLDDDVNLGGVPGVPVSGDDAAGLAAPNSAPAAPRSGQVQQARLLTSVPPAYPPLARSQGVGGNVVVDALIETNGRVSAVKIVSGHPLLQRAAMDAVRKWRYQPAMLDGKPVTMHLMVTIQFRLHQ